MHMNKTLVNLALLACLTASVAQAEEANKITQAQIDAIVNAQPMPAAQLLGDNCSACHGTKGAEFDEAMPPLAGMKKEHFVALMKAFRANEFPTIVMHDVAYVFTDAEIEAMGDYFAAQEAKQWTQANFKGGH
jgi:cytochrome c553